MRAGLSATYVHDFIHGKSPAADQALKAICDEIGILWEWLDGQISEPEPVLKSEPALPSEQVVLLLLESLIRYFTPGKPKTDRELQASQLLSILLEVAGDPGIHFYDLKNDEAQRERLRNVIDFAVRATFRR